MRRKDNPDTALPNISTYCYFEYVDASKSVLMDRVMDMASKPVFTDMNGIPQFAYNIYGLNIPELLELDVEMFDRLEQALEIIASQMNKKAEALGKLDIGKEFNEK